MRDGKGGAIGIVDGQYVDSARVGEQLFERGQELLVDPFRRALLALNHIHVVQHHAAAPKDGTTMLSFYPFGKAA
jgi:hypothetical protein